MSSNVLLIRIFIARPADAESEATLVKNACSEISKAYDPRGIVVVAKDYKDILASGGHPQRTIEEKLLNPSDILVYIMCKSIGNKAFKSEIQNGLKKYRDNGTPFIFYLKSQVLSKREEKSRGKVLDIIKTKSKYTEFKTDIELVCKIEAQIAQEINLIYETSKEKSLTVVETDKQISNSMPEKTKVITQTVTAKALIKRADGNDISLVIQKALGDLNNVNNLSEYEKSRLYLHAASLIFGKEISSETLGNHEINLLYKYKERVKTVGDEVDLIFRSLISDLYHQRAGWYWLQKIKKFDIILYYSMSLFINDSSDEVKIGALNLMDHYWDKRFFNVIKKNSNDISENVQDKVIEVLTNHPAKQSLEIIDTLAKSSGSLTEKFKNATISVLFNIDVHQLIELVIKDDEIKSYNINEQLYEKAYDEELQRLFRHKEEGIRIGAFKQLIRRGTFTNDQLGEHVQDKNWVIRYLAIQELVNKNLINTPSLINKLLKDGNKPFFSVLDYREEELTKIIYKRLAEDKLTQYVDWSIDGSVAYEIYSLRKWGEIKDKVRSDLKDEFRTKRKEILTTMAAKLNCSFSDLEASYKEYDDFITNTFIEATLRVLLEKGDPTDKHFAYKFIEKDNYRITPICQKILAKYGSEEDAQFLFDYSIKNNRIDTALLVKAFELDKDMKHDLIEKGFSSTNKNLPVVTLSYCLNKKVSLTSDQDSKVLEMLKHKDSSVRELAFAYIINFYSTTKLKRLLIKYQTTYPYYYNVVAYLDLILYAHTKLKNSIKTELTEKLRKKI